eukprot:TRINITY_DN2067_c0_g1_i2.p1 TRINITY_DN2067_c0_g1~~TRINITY_DN2067_c0_g1_i2.p1  ORF type:complete len:195 (-),score=3.46 TRINITY_DN2067_c0_g1_i2:313-897(-)
MLANVPSTAPVGPEDDMEPAPGLVYRQIDDMPGGNDGRIVNNYYYHGALPVAEQRPDLAPSEIQKHLGGEFAIGSLLGRGAFGAVYSLSAKSFRAEDAHLRFVLKVSNQDVTMSPYLLRKPVCGGFLYILSEGMEEEFWQKCRRALRYLGTYLHTRQRRAHGDVSPGNFGRSPLDSKSAPTCGSARMARTEPLC